MQMQKKTVIRKDGRYIIYYSFTDTEEKKEIADVRVEMESHPEEVGHHSHSTTEQDL